MQFIIGTITAGHVSTVDQGSCLSRGRTEHLRSTRGQGHHLNSLSQQAGLLVQLPVLGGALGNVSVQLLQVRRKLGPVGLRLLCLEYQQRILLLDLFNLQAKQIVTHLSTPSLLALYTTHLQ